MMSRITLRLGFIILLLVCITRSALAHDAVLIRSQPAAGARLAQPPDEVAIWFSEELISQNSHLTLFNSRGEAIRDGGVDLHDPSHASMAVELSPLVDGIYTVYWKAALLDGDETEGTIVFTVGQPDPRERAFEPTAVSTTNQSARTAVFITIAVVVIFGLGIRLWRRTN